MRTRHDPNGTVSRESRSRWQRSKRRRISRLWLLSSLVVPLAVSSAAVAQPITLGGFTFESNASADHGVLLPGAAPSFFLCCSRPQS